MISEQDYPKDFVLFSGDTDVSPVIPNTNNYRKDVQEITFPRDHRYAFIVPSVNIMSNWIQNKFKKRIHIYLKKHYLYIYIYRIILIYIIKENIKTYCLKAFVFIYIVYVYALVSSKIMLKREYGNIQTLSKFCRIHKESLFNSCRVLLLKCIYKNSLTEKLITI